MGKIIFFYEKIYSESFFNGQKNNNNHDHDNNGLLTSHLRRSCLFINTFLHECNWKITPTSWAPDTNYVENNYQKKNNYPRVGLNHPPFI